MAFWCFFSTTFVLKCFSVIGILASMQILFLRPSRNRRSVLQSCLRTSRSSVGLVELRHLSLVALGDVGIILGRFTRLWLQRYPGKLHFKQLGPKQSHDAQTAGAGPTSLGRVLCNRNGGQDCVSMSLLAGAKKNTYIIIFYRLNDIQNFTVVCHITWSKWNWTVFYEHTVEILWCRVVERN